MSDKEKTYDYPAPVNQLLAYGDCMKMRDWPDYLKLGLTQEHVSDLIRMATDMDLHWEDGKSLYVWAPVHAWRALGQLRAEAAIEPLIPLFHAFEEQGGSDWTSDELPQVFAMIGAAAIPAFSAYLADATHIEYPRADASSSLRHIAEAHPETREQVVAILTLQLEDFTNNGEFLNSLIINDLMDLKAVESLPVIQKAFEADVVDLMVQGDYDDVLVDMGLKEPDPDKISVNRGIFSRLAAMFPDTADIDNKPSGERQVFGTGFDLEAMKAVRKRDDAARKKEKAKRKHTKKMKKQNRKR
ncbi:MAG: DUF1186 domain-containing protein [Chloroflexota bacterium]